MIVTIREVLPRSTYWHDVFHSVCFCQLGLGSCSRCRSFRIAPPNTLSAWPHWRCNSTGGLSDGTGCPGSQDSQCCDLSLQKGSFLLAPSFVCRLCLRNAAVRSCESWATVPTSNCSGSWFCANRHLRASCALGLHGATAAFHGATRLLRQRRCPGSGR